MASSCTCRRDISARWSRQANCWANIDNERDMNQSRWFGSPKSDMDSACSARRSGSVEGWITIQCPPPGIILRETKTQSLGQTAEVEKGEGHWPGTRCPSSCRLASRHSRNPPPHQQSLPIHGRAANNRPHRGMQTSWLFSPGLNHERPGQTRSTFMEIHPFCGVCKNFASRFRRHGKCRGATIAVQK